MDKVAFLVASLNLQVYTFRAFSRVRTATKKSAVHVRADRTYIMTTQHQMLVYKWVAAKGLELSQDSQQLRCCYYMAP